MKTLRKVNLLGLVAVICFLSSMASGQTYPNHSITIIAPGAGGNADAVGRIIAQGISGPLGQPVVVVNKADAITGSSTAQATPDGYTLLVQSNGLWTEQLFRPVAYDVTTDLVPITIATKGTIVLVVNSKLSIYSVKDLIEYGKSHPGKLNFASSGIGSQSHLVAQLFMEMTGISMVHVPYKGTGATVAALTSGEVDTMFSTSRFDPEYVRSLAITSAKPSVLYPSLPTIAASGLPDFATNGTMVAIWAPAGTPPAIIQRLNMEIVRFISTPEATARLAVLGNEVVGNTPAEASDLLKGDIAQWAKVIKDNNIHRDE